MAPVSRALQPTTFCSPRSQAAGARPAATVALWHSRHPCPVRDTAPDARFPVQPKPGADLMALKATIYKAALQIADMDRGLYADHALTLALHPSETEERLMVRLLAFALQVPADDHGGALQFARGLADSDEPDLWQHDLTGQLLHWMEVGQPDDRRLAKASGLVGRKGRVTLYGYSASTPVWWAAMQGKVARLSNLAVWQLPAEQSQALARMAQRSMQLQITVQDGQLWVGDGKHSVELQPTLLQEPRP